MMNEQKKIKYIKELSENGLIHQIIYQDINFLINISGGVEQVANDFNPKYLEDQVTNALKKVMRKSE